MVSAVVSVVFSVMVGVVVRVMDRCSGRGIAKGSSQCSGDRWSSHDRGTQREREVGERDMTERETREFNKCQQR